MRSDKFHELCVWFSLHCRQAQHGGAQSQTMYALAPIIKQEGAVFLKLAHCVIQNANPNIKDGMQPQRMHCAFKIGKLVFIAHLRLVT